MSFYKPEHAREDTVQSKWWELSSHLVNSKSLHLCWQVGSTCGLPPCPGSSSSIHGKHSMPHGVSAVPMLGDWCCCKHMSIPHWNAPHPWSSNREEKAFWSLMSTLISCHQPTDEADELTYLPPWACWNVFHGLLGLWGPERYWPLLMITEWLLRWVMFSWKPWRLKSSLHEDLFSFKKKKNLALVGAEKSSKCCI